MEEGSLALPAEGDKALSAQLECGICLSLLCEPITIGCGHTFCRVCLCGCLRRRKKCPTCRAVCYVSPEDAQENVMISNIAKTFFPELYEQRAREAAQEKANWSTLMPVFFYNVPMFPGERLSLHLFEHRYKLMMQRIVNSSRCFAYVPKYDGYTLQDGDVAIVSKLEEVQFLTDGRCLLEARLTTRKSVVEHYVEESTGGLHYCRLVDLVDEPLNETDAALFDTEAERVSNLIQQICDDCVLQRIQENYGKMPNVTEREAYSLWIAAVIPGPVSTKDSMLRTNNSLERLRAALRLLEQMRPRSRQRQQARQEEEADEKNDDASDEST